MLEPQHTHLILILIFLCLIVSHQLFSLNHIKKKCNCLKIWLPLLVSDDISYSYDDDEDFLDTEEDFPEVEGIATVSFDSPAQNEMQTPEEDFDHVDMPDDMEDGFQEVFAGSPRKWAGRSTQIPDMDVVCTEYGFQVTFLSPLTEVKVLGMCLSSVNINHHCDICVCLFSLCFVSFQEQRKCCLWLMLLWLVVIKWTPKKTH